MRGFPPTLGWSSPRGAKKPNPVSKSLRVWTIGIDAMYPEGLVVPRPESNIRFPNQLRSRSGLMHDDDDDWTPEPRCTFHEIPGLLIYTIATACSRVLYSYLIRSAPTPVRHGGFPIRPIPDVVHRESTNKGNPQGQSISLLTPATSSNI